MPNALAQESSPYLLQHQNNPVDWFPWGAEALERAKRDDKPIFLSIGYSACHWCHVMEHESFESEPIARYLNEHFVSVKVDREERPDLDQIYMNAVQALTGRGGWPMSVFLTTDLKPFYGGTYWPPTPRMGMPGFDQVLGAVQDAWQNRRESVLKQADELTSYLHPATSASGGRPMVSGGRKPAGGPSATTNPTTIVATAAQLLENAVRSLSRVFDPRHGGFGTGPKFPHSMDLQLLLRLWKRQPRQDLLEMVTHTLDKMSTGGIYDHLAGGFARYSIDERWIVPHFEKMLYDNALLTSALLDTYLVTREERFATTARETCRYILAYMTDAAGGFHSTEDADSEGEEGKFYVWTPAEIEAVLGQPAADRFCYLYDVTEHGNFEHGKSILNLPKTIEQAAKVRGWNASELAKELADSRAKLLTARDQRVRPGKDDKILVSWNALMIDALARAGRILDEPEFVIAAEKAAQFILDHLRKSDGRLLHTWRHGHAKLDAYLDDYAYLTNAFVTLYEATFNEHWIDEAKLLADQMLTHFEDRADGGFFFTADDHEQLITRNKDIHDASVPSGNAMAATALLRLGKLVGSTTYLESATRTLEMAVPTMERASAAAGQLLIALDLWRGPSQELVLLGGNEDAENQKLLNSLWHTYLPSAVLAYRPQQLITTSTHLDALFAGRSPVSGEPVLYICENFSCQAPITGTAAIQQAIA